MSNRNYKLDVTTRKQGNIRVRDNLVNGYRLVEIFLHGHCIVSIDYEFRTIRLNACGWNTASTRDAMNTALRHMGLGNLVSKRKDTLLVAMTTGIENLDIPVRLAF